MAKLPAPLRFLNSTPVRVVTVLLLLQAVALRALSRNEIVPDTKPLSDFPIHVGAWTRVQEGYVDPEAAAVLRADDLLNRTYARVLDTAATNLFIASFKSQRTGKSPHSPKNCLPGAGWMQSEAGTTTIDIPGYAPVEVNRYIVSKGPSRSVVLYWYQSRDRSVASEYKAKVYVVLDSMRYNRTDTALVRVVTPVLGNDDASAVKTATQFVRDIYPAVRAALPN